MPTNKQPWVRNLYGAPEPLRMLGRFQAGSSQAVKQGELIKLSSSVWLPVNADASMSATLAIAAEEIKAGDLAGYYEMYVARDGDVWEFAIATAAATALGTQAGYSNSQTLSASASNKWFTHCGQEHYPLKQEHMSDGQTADHGTTIRSSSYFRGVMIEACSYFAAFQK